MKRVQTLRRLFLRPLCVAFSIYSKIPMPRFEWGTSDMQYHLIYFPWVGGVIAALILLWNRLCGALPIPSTARILVAAAIPLLISGGFHLDGYMDTMDAVHSWQDRERRLEIMSDPHVGAFAVQSVILYYLLYLAGLSLIRKGAVQNCAAGLFFLSRALSALGVVTIPAAKKSGMLQTFQSTAQKRAVRAVLVIELMLCVARMIALSPVAGICVPAAGLLTYVYYCKMSLSRFGGITGDLAGYFVTLSELVMTLTAGVVSIIL